MKGIFILILFIGPFTLAQKTIYEKKCDKIQSNLYSTIGVSDELIELAISTNNWDVVGYSTELSVISKSMDQNLLMSLLIAAGEELKSVEKLKSSQDFQRELEKNKRKYYKYSDSYKLNKKIDRKFYRWLEQGEFESKENYNVRFQTRQIAFDSICQVTLTERLGNKIRDELLIKLEKFNPNDLTFKINFEHRITEQKLIATVKVPSIEKGKIFKEKLNRSYWRLSKVLSDDPESWIAVGDNFFPSNILGFKVEYNGNASLIILKSNDLNYSKVLGANLKYDNQKLLRAKQRIEALSQKKMNLLQIESKKLMLEKNYVDAKTKYNQILEIEPVNTIGLNGLKVLDSIFLEFKRDSLLKIGSITFDQFDYYTSVENYQKAKRIRTTPELDSIIHYLDKEIGFFEINLRTIDSLYNFYKVNQNFEIKGYYKTKAGKTKDLYANCYVKIIQYLNRMISDESDVKLTNLLIEKSGYWSNENQEVLNILIEKSRKIREAQVIEGKVERIIQIGSRKEMKKFKSEQIEDIINNL